jgi:DNA-binding transcriptional MerR regulator
MPPDVHLGDPDERNCMSETACWRIDDLAQRAGLTVDTIRYYAREKLLPAPIAAGRNKLYGREHLERLERVKKLQERRFSLAAIRELLAVDRPDLDGLFLGSGQEYDREALIERSGLGAEFVDRMHDVGLLADPGDLGKSSYDDTDLSLLRNVAELLAIGMTETIVVELGKIYVRHFRELQREVHATLAGEGHDDWLPDDLDAIQRRLTANAARMLPAIDRVLGYVHQRTVQQLTLESIRRAKATGTGVGGVAAIPDL